MLLDYWGMTYYCSDWLCWKDSLTLSACFCYTVYYCIVKMLVSAYRCLDEWLRCITCIYVTSPSTVYYDKWSNSLPTAKRGRMIIVLGWLHRPFSLFGASWSLTFFGTRVIRSAENLQPRLVVIQSLFSTTNFKTGFIEPPFEGKLPKFWAGPRFTKDLKIMLQ